MGIYILDILLQVVRIIDVFDEVEILKLQRQV